MLLVTALIWGAALVAQSVAMDHIGPLTFLAARFLISGVVLSLFLLLRKKLVGEERFLYRPEEWEERKKTALFGGFLCGVFLFFGNALQQFGIQTIEAGKAGFLTALYIILVPIYSIALGKRPGIKIWFAAVLALFGLYLLCIEKSFSFVQGDLLCLFCAFVFPLQILALDYFVMKTDVIFLSCVEFWTVGLVSLILAFLLETPTCSAIKAAGTSILYAGVMSGAVAYTFQGVAQRKMQNPTAASLIMSLEAVFAVLAAWVLIGETLSVRKLVGCAIMFLAIVLAQV